MKPLRICIDARLVGGTAGGLESVIVGLASGLSKLTDGEEEYWFLTYPGADSWLKPYIKLPCQILYCPPPFRQRLKRWMAKVSPVIRRDLWGRLSQLAGWQQPGRVPYSDGTIEKAGADLMHFVRQDAFLTEVPSIYHPHDLLHVHFPKFFSQRERLAREYAYRKFSEEARMVAVASSWVKFDVVRHFGLPEDKVHVVPWAPVLEAYNPPSETDLLAARLKFSLPESYVFYPAQTWPHKNHLGLLQALAILREKYNLAVPLILSGRQNEFYFPIRKRVHELNLSDQVRFLGFVNPIELQCLYRLCRCVIIPTKFEAASGPLWEAFVAGVPGACSNVTSLPQQAGDAALIFDPDNHEEMAEVIFRLWTDETLRSRLVVNGRQNVSRFSWERTARLFRAHYGRIANRPLSEQERALLAATPLL